MPFEKFLLAAPVALAALLVPTLLSAETLRILRGDPSAAIKVLPGSKVIVESDMPIEMVSIAIPKSPT